MPKPRDSQRSKFYNWKRTQLEQLGIGGLCLEKNVYLVLDSYLNRYLTNTKITLKHTIKSTHTIQYSPVGKCVSYTSKDGSCNFSDIALAVAWIVIHTRGNSAWHGPEFCRIYAEVFSDLSGVDTRAIILSMQSAKLKVSGAPNNVPIGPRVQKKYDRLCITVNQLETSIEQARQEFELFLDPVKVKLKEAQIEKEKIEQRMVASLYQK